MKSNDGSSLHTYVEINCNLYNLAVHSYSLHDFVLGRTSKDSKKDCSVNEQLPGKCHYSKNSSSFYNAEVIIANHDLDFKMTDDSRCFCPGITSKPLTLKYRTNTTKSSERLWSYLSYKSCANDYPVRCENIADDCSVIDFSLFLKHASCYSTVSIRCTKTSGKSKNEDENFYSRFQVVFQSAISKFVLNIPNYITKFGILRGNLLSQICKLLN